MIIEYHLSKTMEDALELIGREAPKTWPLGGGTKLNQPSRSKYAVADLQALGLDKINEKGKFLHVGAASTLQSLLNHQYLPEAVKRAIIHEATYNLRHVATIAGTLISADGRSPFATVMLALDAELVLMPAKEKIALSELLPLREQMKGKLVTSVIIPQEIRICYDYVARSPADLPIVCVAIGQWESERTRVVVGGFGESPIVAFDGPNSEGAEEAARSVCSEADDEWGSAAYRVHVAEVLAQRCIERVSAIP